MSYLDRIATCRRWDPAAYLPFVVDGRTLGRVGHGFAGRLADFPTVFLVDEDSVALAPGLDGFEARSAAVHEVLIELKAQGEIPLWRGEDYPVLLRWGEEPALKIERAASTLLGTRRFGVSVNGLVRRAGRLEMWVGKRAANKQTDPGKLDHLVAGGQPFGLGVGENMIKEAWEEAGVPAEMAAAAIPVGAVSFRCERPEGLLDEVAFCYDLELPADFTPANTDGEVESFSLWPIEEVLARVRDSEDFSFDVNLAVIDFAIRHGLIAPDDPDYQEIWQGLRMDGAFV
jgi:8-oxo-dGTP pyrophosphatase MutT (NUDIX family)